MESSNSCRTIDSDWGGKPRPCLFLYLYLIHYLSLDLSQYLYLYRYLNLDPYLCLYLYPYLYLYLVGMEGRNKKDRYHIRHFLVDLERTQSGGKHICMKKKKNLISCCTTWLKQPRCLIVRRKQFLVLFRVGVYPCFNWVPAYAFHAPHLTNGYKPKPDIMWGAWGRCVLQKERSHVSL